MQTLCPRSAASAAAGRAPAPPMFTPFKVRELVLKNRIVVSPMAQYSAVDGCVLLEGQSPEDSLAQAATAEQEIIDNAKSK